MTSVKGAALADGLGSIGIRNGDLAPPPTRHRRPPPSRHPRRRRRPDADADTDPGAFADSDPTPVPGDFTWQPPAGSVPAQGTVLYVESAAGDYVGQGQTHLYTLANSLIGVSTTGSRIDLSIDGEEYWDASLVEPAGSAVVTGFWANLPGYTGGNAPALRFFGEGRSCISGSVNRFAVDEVTYDDGSLRSLTARFEQRCNATAPPLLGFLRFDVNDPTTPPPPGDPAAFSWAPPSWVVPTSGNYLYYESQPGDYIGQGQTRLVTTYLATFSVTESSGHVRARMVQGNFDTWWDLDVSGPDAQDQLVPASMPTCSATRSTTPWKAASTSAGTGAAATSSMRRLPSTRCRTTPTACAR